MSATNWQKLKPILTAKGLLTEHGNTRYATAKPCPSCGATILAGIDWTIEGLLPPREIHTDAEPLSAAGELTALMLGRATYDLRLDHATDRWQLRLRTCTRPDIKVFNSFRRNPIGPKQKWDVVAAHQCGTRLPSQPTVAPPVRRTNYNAPPPF